MGVCVWLCPGGVLPAGLVPVGELLALPTGDDGLPLGDADGDLSGDGDGDWPGAGEGNADPAVGAGPGWPAAAALAPARGLVA